MQKKIVGVCVVAMLSILFLSSGTVYAKSQVTFPHSYGSPRGIARSYLRAINRMRSQTQRCGSYGTFSPAPPLRWSRQLYGAAFEHARDMAAYGYMGHRGSGKQMDISGRRYGGRSSLTQRIANNGYRPRGSYRLAENVAAGQRTLGAVVRTWMLSPAHCINIMNPQLRVMGLAKATNRKTRYKYYWALTLGSGN